jgi:hypothetical protein
MRNLRDRARLQGLQKPTGCVGVKLWVDRFDTNEKAIPTRQSKPRDIEYRVIRHREPIESQHPEYRCQRGAQHRRLKGNRINEGQLWSGALNLN